MQRFALNAGGARGATSSQPDACSSSMPPVATPNRGTPPLTPGQYTVRLTLDGQTYTQPVTLKPDPRDAN